MPNAPPAGAPRLYAKAIPTAPATSSTSAATSQVRGDRRRSSPHQTIPLMAPAEGAQRQRAAAAAHPVGRPQVGDGRPVERQQELHRRRQHQDPDGGASSHGPWSAEPRRRLLLAAGGLGEEVQGSPRRSFAWRTARTGTPPSRRTGGDGGVDALAVDLDQDAASVAGVGDAPGEALALQPVDQGGDRRRASPDRRASSPAVSGPERSSRSSASCWR